MSHDTATAALFVEDLLVHVLNENGVSFRFCRRHLNASHKVFKPVFSPEMGKVVSHFSSKYKSDYQPIFDKIIEKMQHLCKSLSSSRTVLLISLKNLANSLLYDREDPKKFFIFCAMLSEMFLQCYKKGYGMLMADVVRCVAFQIDDKLRWNKDNDLKKYEIFSKDFKVDGT